ncbi:MAG: hypothetical protein ABWY82_17235, partial [Tardiphaga sp.]
SDNDQAFRFVAGFVTASLAAHENPDQWRRHAATARPLTTSSPHHCEEPLGDEAIQLLPSSWLWIAASLRSSR